jgi:hypothetical protein
MLFRCFYGNRVGFLRWEDSHRTALRLFGGLRRGQQCANVYIISRRGDAGLLRLPVMLGRAWVMSSTMTTVRMDDSGQELSARTAS